MSRRTFVEACLEGEALLDDIDDYVDVWHRGGTGMPLWKFLGFTHSEYKLWAEKPNSLGFIESLYDELLPNFTSGLLNVGCDETFDLGLGRSKAEVEARGRERVYLEFLLKIHRAVILTEAWCPVTAGAIQISDQHLAIPQFRNVDARMIGYKS